MNGILKRKKTESVQHVQNIQYVYLLNKYIKMQLLEVSGAVRHIYIYVIRQLKVKWWGTALHVSGCSQEHPNRNSEYAKYVSVL